MGCIWVKARKRVNKSYSVAIQKNNVNNESRELQIKSHEEKYGPENT